MATKKNWIIALAIISSIILIIATIAAPFIFTRPSKLGISFSDTGQIGDTIGGITSPFLAFLASVLTFCAFYIQYDANKKQLTSIEAINERDQIRDFETKLFSMYDTHRKNVDEINVEIRLKKQVKFIKGQDFFIISIYCFLHFMKTHSMLWRK